MKVLQHFFTGKEWRELDAVALRRYDASMHYFTPSAFRYFLPAFMLAELDDPEKADILGDYVVYQFEEPPPLGLKDFSQRIEQFSENEKEAILMFLNYMQSKYGGFEQQVSYAAAWLAANKALHRTSR